MNISTTFKTYYNEKFVIAWEILVYNVKLKKEDAQLFTIESSTNEKQTRKEQNKMSITSWIWDYR